MTRGLLPPTLVVALLGVSCIESWKGVDGDGDGYSVAQGDCWDSPSSPDGSTLSGADIHPGADDEPYDGIDADCANNDDYDLDGDGWVKSEDHVGKTTLGVPDSGVHEGSGDCWNDPARPHDFDSFEHGMIFTNVSGDQLGPGDVFPGADDAWYDGPDQDCAGNNDFDQDGDGDSTDKIADQYGALGGDCVDLHPDDNPDANLGGLAPEDINSNASELLYDGTDQDCSGVYSSANADIVADCDADDDGAPVANTADVEEDSPCLAYDDLPDCNDDDARAVPDPDVDEVFYNGVDDNCSPETADGRSDVDGDADRDGYWDVGYYDRVPEPDSTVDTSEADFSDCWDNPEDRPDGYTGTPIYAFDPDADPDDTSTWTILFDAGSLTAAEVNPSALDRPYDGVDQDCAGDATLDNEYDWDGDGDRTQMQEHVESTTGNLVSGGDCMDCSANCDGVTEGDDWFDLCSALCDNDSYVDNGSNGYINPAGLASENVYPGADETWYDGTDQDCGRDIDYDRDQDRVPPDGGTDDFVSLLVLQGESRPAYYDWDNASSEYPDGTEVPAETDCNDTDATISPRLGADDVWYDGVDTDCEGNDDYDQDYDLYVDDANLGTSTYQSRSPDSAYLVDTSTRIGGNDCVETDANYNPGASEIWYDSFDYDCRNDDDYDQDGDGVASEAEQASYGDTFHGTIVAVNGTLDTDDCDDTDPAITPAATAETWYDGVDQNCDEADDWDADGDGHAWDGATGYTVTVNESGPITGTGLLDTDDCNDEDDEVYTGATDVWYDGIDHDCDEADDYDQDADGYASLAYESDYDSTYQSTTFDRSYVVSGSGSFAADDCNDEDNAINTGATDTWFDNIDQDCDNEDDFDEDYDGYVEDGYVGELTYQSSTLDSAYLVSSTGDLPGNDCVEGDATYNPAATEVWYDGFDYDCKDDDDWDQDQDGHALEGTTVTYDQTTHAGTPIRGTGDLDVDDCNDVDDEVYTGATDDWYDGIDHDCDGADDFDQDADGYASAEVTYDDTYQSTTYDVAYQIVGTLTADDCNDYDDQINTGTSGTDIWYDGIDTDCAGNDDYDADFDGYVPTEYVNLSTYQSSSSSVAYIVGGTGELPGDDCVDDDSSYNPAAADAWYDGFDNDCADNDDWDQDEDGHALEGTTVPYGDTYQDTEVVVGTGDLDVDDCNDVDDQVYTGATDSWYDGIDHDCDEADDFDQDVDGYASDAYTYTATFQSSTLDSAYEVSTTGGLTDDDCNDEEAVINPGATDTWQDGIDNDCGGEDDYDNDADDYVEDAYVGLQTYQSAVSDASYLLSSTGGLAGDDCVEGDSSYNPAAADTWYDGFDNDCADNDDWDQDEDGQALEGSTVPYSATYHASTPVPGTGALADTDCNDIDDQVYVGATDSWYDGVDNDCDEADDFDQDVDGYASDAYTYTATFQSSTKLSAYRVSSTGSLSDDDCNDEEAVINPGATDTWQDGIDHDCGGEDDYDVDADDYVEDAYVGLQTYQSAVSDASYLLASTGGLGGDDCVEGDSSYNPAATDIWYDGFDNDCADNDDWDQDEDDHALEGTTVPYGDTFQDTDAVAGTGDLDVDDCNDVDNQVFTGAPDTWYDGIDNDCDDADDYDQDSDGYASLAEAGSYDTTFQSTTYDSSYAVIGTGSLAATDCNDEESVINPGATDTWQDGIDQDCGGNDDYDIDGDNYVEDAYVGLQTYQSAVSDATYVLSSTGSLSGNDCVESNSAYNPAASDSWYDGFDHDCADNDDYDRDDDGHAIEDPAVTYGSTFQGSTVVSGTGSLADDDCNDTEANIYEGHPSDVLYDGVDSNCDDADDYDADEDGYVPTAYSGLATYHSYVDTTTSTWLVSGTGALPDGDCLDIDALTFTGADYNPGVTDTWYDGQDTDCQSDDDYDADVDTFVDDSYVGTNTLVATTVVHTAAGSNGGECNDNDASFYPGAADTWYDGQDTNCDSADDYDQDGDGYVQLADAGKVTYTDSTSTNAVSGTGALPTDDCQDDDSAINPDATEVCDAGDVDEDCNGVADDDDSGVDTATQTTYYVDGDGDTYGLDGSGTLFCNEPASGYATEEADCDDGDSSIHDYATELPGDEVDQDCDEQELCYADADNDDYSDESGATVVSPDIDCTGSGENTSAEPQTDCEDTDASINPGQTEVCDASDVDEDCNDLADDADPGVDTATYSDWYTDSDGDGYGDENDTLPTSQCNAPSNTADDNTDCDDADEDINPGASEALDGIDNDCDGSYEEGLLTADSEYVLITEIMINPDATTDANGEWFEIYNPNAFDIVLDTNWVFFDEGPSSSSSGYQLSSPLTILAGEYAVFSDEDSTVNGNVVSDGVYGGNGIGSLHNTDDSLTAGYFDPDDPATDTGDLATAVVVDVVDWNTALPGWSITAGSTVQLDNDGGYPTASNDLGSNWCDATTPWDTGDNGSPGLDNEACP